jgi:hypothetical protein
MGSAMSIYSATCTSKMANYSSSISAFATHSTGLKLKDDGIKGWPTISEYNSEENQGYAWSECPNCYYFPAIVEKSDMKACINDNTEDSSEANPNFYTSS